MIGHLESYDQNVQTGVIKYEGRFFEFHIDVWTSELPPKGNTDVDFLLDDEDNVIEVGFLGAYVKDIRPKKYRWLAILLALPTGCLGLHRFYLGFYSIGIAQLIFTAIMGSIGFFGMSFVWGFMEGFLLFTKHIHKDAKGRPLK